MPGKYALRMKWRFTLRRLFVAFIFIGAALATLRLGGQNALWVVPFAGAAIGTFAGWEGALLGAILASLVAAVLIGVFGFVVVFLF